MVIQICVGSACHLKNSEEIIELFQKAVEENQLNNEVTLTGRFCAGKCNRVGVTVTIDDKIHTGVTKGSFKEFFNEKVLSVLTKEGV